MKHKHSYTWPHRSRRAMIDYLAEHESYGGWNHPYRRWSPLSWNVKLSPKFDGKRGDYNIDADWDDDWEDYVTGEAGSHLWNWIVEDMRRTYTESEYTTYPGDDQGDWKFCFAGRSGGHMLLEEWTTSYTDVKGRRLRADFLRQFDRESWREWLEGCSWYQIRTLYRAVRCMDHDFTHQKMNDEFAYQLNFRRHEWEEEQCRNEVFEQAKAGLEPCPVI